MSVKSNLITHRAPLHLSSPRFRRAQKATRPNTFFRQPASATQTVPSRALIVDIGFLKSICSSFCVRLYGLKVFLSMFYLFLKTFYIIPTQWSRLL